MKFGRAALALIGTVLCLSIASCSGESTPTPLPTATQTPTSTPLPNPANDASPHSRIPDIVKKLRPSVVHIQTEAVRLDVFNRPIPVGGVGSGEVLDLQGHILTNNHVIAGAERILVTLSDGRGLEAVLVGGDSSIDLAVIKVEAEDLTPILIGSSSELEVGEQVVAMGHALDLPGGPTVTSGLVSALERSITVDERITIEHLIQTDAAINPGNSGGPLVNLDGEMVGVNTAKIQSGEGIGFAIAIDPAMPLIEELIADGRIGRGFLGVSRYQYHRKPRHERGTRDHIRGGNRIRVTRLTSGTGGPTRQGRDRRDREQDCRQHIRPGHRDDRIQGGGCGGGRVFPRRRPTHRNGHPRHKA